MNTLTDEQLLERLEELGYASVQINDENRMYAMALIYDIESDMNGDRNETLFLDSISDDLSRPYNDLRRGKNRTTLVSNLMKSFSLGIFFTVVSPHVKREMNWEDYLSNVKQVPAP